MSEADTITPGVATTPLPADAYRHPLIMLSRTGQDQIEQMLYRATVTGYLLRTNVGLGTASAAAGRFFEEWTTGMGAYPFVLYSALSPQVPASAPLYERISALTFSTPRIRRWGAINNALLMLTGEPDMTNKYHKASSRAGGRVTAFSDRFDWNFTSPASARAALQVLDLPANRSFLSSYATRGPRRKGE